MSKFVLITESALDAALVSGEFDTFSVLPAESANVHAFGLTDEISGFRATTESSLPYLALIRTEWVKQLQSEGGTPGEIYRRIARVIKGLRSPPIHLPRQWLEYHFKNMLTFFALPRDVCNVRWIVDIRGESRCARFDHLTSADAGFDLQSFSPKDWPNGFESAIKDLLSREVSGVSAIEAKAFAREFDLERIGSGSVVDGRTYDEWLTRLSDNQQALLDSEINASLRIVGPAGSGKTLSLCMRALKVSRDQHVRAQGQRILLATHSWAMSERIDGVLCTLNEGVNPSGITVFPLLSLLELHTGRIGQEKTNFIGDDSTDGRVKSLEIIGEALTRLDLQKHPGVSNWIRTAANSAPDSNQRRDLTLDLYEELTGVLTASGVAPDDQESIQKYLNAPREDWMPPFESVADRGYVIAV